MTESSATEAPKIPADDMGEWPPWPDGISEDTLAELKKTREAIAGVYQQANDSAGFNLWCHRLVAGSIAFFGTYAVLTAIVQLYFPSPTSAETEDVLTKTLATAEIVFAVLALVALLAGLLGKFMAKWLVRRHRAERCRFLKFDFLLDVALAARDQGSLQRAARSSRAAVDQLKEIEDDQMERWLEEEQVLQNPPVVTGSETVLADLRTLAKHYLSTRLAVQSQYFSKQSKRDDRRGSRTGNFTAILFGASICFALVHFSIDRWFHVLRRASPYFILLAAALPVAGAGLRFARGISEYSRNALRFEAKYNALGGVISKLGDEMAGQPQAEHIVRNLWTGEQILEGEHREWLRLMIETEWIG